MRPSKTRIAVQYFFIKINFCAMLLHYVILHLNRPKLCVQYIKNDLKSTHSLFQIHNNKG